MSAMASLTSVEEYLGLLRRSQLLDDRALSACLQSAQGQALPRTAHALAGLLVQEALLTNYQAVQVLQGQVDHLTIGPYKILERLGFGAVSNVYLCERPVTRAWVAVKVLAKLQAADPTTVQRFYREARAAGSLHHPNIVPAHDVDQDQHGHFMVMDFVDGSSIQDIVQQFGPMDIGRSAHYIRQAALGLQCAHEHRLVHRDVKPGNLLIDRTGTVKILDMGLARFAEEEGGVLTQGVILGAPEYLAPEQALDSHNVDTRADVYGLGATFYFMLTGQPPYAEEKTLAKKIVSKQARDPQPIASLRPEVPADLVAVVERMMARDLSQRFPTPQAVVEALASWTRTPIPPPPDREMPQLSPALLGGRPSSARHIEGVSSDSRPQNAVEASPAAPAPVSEAGAPAPASALAPTPSLTRTDDAAARPTRAPSRASRAQRPRRKKRARDARKPALPRQLVQIAVFTFLALLAVALGWSLLK